MVRLNQELGIDLPFQDLYHEAVLNIMRTASSLETIGAGLFRHFDLTLAQFNVLLSLKYRSHELTQSDLSRCLVVTRATVTSVLDRLEGKGFIERKAVVGNRRVNHVCLTPAGEVLIAEVEPEYRAAIHRIMEAVGEAECRQLIRVMEKVREQMMEV